MRGGPQSSSFASFASAESTSYSPSQEAEHYQVEELRLLGQLQGCFCCCTSCVEERDARYSAGLKADLARGRAYWTGDLAADYGFHVANEHPLLGCFLCHPAHPLQKLDRFAVLLLVSFCTFPPIFALLRWGKHLSSGRQRPEQPTELAALEQLFVKLGAQLEILLVVTVPSMAMQLVLECLALLDFQLQENTGMGRLVLCRPLLAGLARCVVALRQGCLAFSLALCGLVAYMSLATLGKKVTPLDALGPFVFSRAQSWTLWFLIDGLTPCCGFLARWCYEGLPRGMRKASRELSQEPNLESMEEPLPERREELQRELSAALEALAKKREEAALLQWRISHLEVELMDLERGAAGADAWASQKAKGRRAAGTPAGWRRS